MSATRIAMWSAPWHRSTAMMRAWGSRADTAVVDEPFYAVYLVATGRRHRGREKIVRAQPTDWRAVTRQLLGPLPPGKNILFQKQMTHHLVPDVDREWMTDMKHGFMIRDPKEVLASYWKKNAKVTAPEELGYPQQVEIFEYVEALFRRTPPVIDASDLLLNPHGVLAKLCEALEVPFSDSMLAWSSGPRNIDGVWSADWYDDVNRSTSFFAYKKPSIEIPEQFESLAEACRPFYDFLHDKRLRAA